MCTIAGAPVMGCGKHMLLLGAGRCAGAPGEGPAGSSLNTHSLPRLLAPTPQAAAMPWAGLEVAAACRPPPAHRQPGGAQLSAALRAGAELWERSARPAACCCRCAGCSLAALCALHQVPLHNLLDDLAAAETGGATGRGVERQQRDSNPRSVGCVVSWMTWRRHTQGKQQGECLGGQLQCCRSGP